jgi:hypothetical protein
MEKIREDMANYFEISSKLV